MPTPVQIQNTAQAAKHAYREVYNVFDRSAQSEGVALRPVFTDCFMVSEKPERFEVRGALRVELLPRRRRAGGKLVPASDRIAVLMSSRDVYKFDDSKQANEASFLDQAYVDIGYYRVVGTIWRALLAVRYDFGQRGATGGHPIFHAQLHKGGAGDSIRHMPLTPTIDPLPEDKVLETVRLPTANMIGASALLKLSADHLSHGSFASVLQSLRGLAFFGNWRCNCSTLDDAGSVRGILAPGWYGSRP